LLNFVKILEKYFEYVVAPSYVSIVFGRARATEDIDIIIKFDEKNLKIFGMK